MRKPPKAPTLTLTPALSLRERENCLPIFPNYGSLKMLGRNGSRSERRPLSPLPAGEGKGEGERLEQEPALEHS